MAGNLYSSSYFFEIFLQAEMHGSSNIKYTPLQCCVVNNIFVYLIGNIFSERTMLQMKYEFLNFSFSVFCTPENCITVLELLSRYIYIS